MANQWYYSKGGEERGPVSDGELRRLAREGELQPTDLVRKDENADWFPARRLTGVFAEKQESPAAPPPLPENPPTAAPTETPNDSEAAETANGVWTRLRSYSTTIWNASKHYWIRYAAWLLGVMRSRRRSAKSPQAENAADSVTPAEAETEPKEEDRLSFREVFRGDATERAKAVPRAVTLGNVFHWLAIAILITGIADAIFDLGGGESEAKVMAETFVRKQLKSPSTADFPWHPDEYTATEIEKNVWRVSGYVDAQNSFGATIRTHWTVIIRYEGRDKWTLISCVFH